MDRDDSDRDEIDESDDSSVVAEKPQLFTDSEEESEADDVNYDKNGIMLSLLRKELAKSGADGELVNSVFNLICGRELDEANVDPVIEKNEEDRIRLFFADLKKQQFMWEEKDVMNETSIEEILALNEKLDAGMVRKMTNKKQSVLPIIDVIIHVIRWAAKAKRHFARDSIQLLNVLRLQLYEGFNKKNDVSHFDVVAMKTLSLKKDSKSRFGLKFKFEKVKGDEAKGSNVDSIRMILSVWHAVYHYLSVTKH